jgi:fermentation-respiration switch protein FrsA (DUF1100 family)
LRPLLISDGWDAEDEIANLGDTRLMLMHGELDPVIPVQHSRDLMKRAPAGTDLLVVEGAGHCDAVLRFPQQVRPVLLDFFRGGASRSVLTPSGP